MTTAKRPGSIMIRFFFFPEFFVQDQSDQPLVEHVARRVRSMSFEERMQPEFARAAAGITWENVRDLLMDLVNIPSPTGNEIGIANYLVERMRRSGMITDLPLVDESLSFAIVACLSLHIEPVHSESGLWGGFHLQKSSRGLARSHHRSDTYLLSQQRSAPQRLVLPFGGLRLASGSPPLLFWEAANAK
jgi:hypothetical protein